VRQSVLSRSTALLVALLVSLSASGLALAHGLTHEHLAHAHWTHGAHGGEGAGHDDHGRALPAVSPARHGHAHDHATLDVAPGARVLVGHVAVAAPVAELPPPRAALGVRTVASPARTDAAVLPRPAPAAGAPSGPRAPPAR